MSRTAKAYLVAEILTSYLLTRWYLRQGALPGVVARLRRTQGPPRGPLGGDQAPRLGRAVSRTLATLPADSRCLMRSLVLLRLLARRGVAGSLVIAARPPSDDAFAAHAWVEIAGRPVLPAGSPQYGRLVTL
jgi:hypothetical protein